MKDCRCGPREWDPACEAEAEELHYAFEKVGLSPETAGGLADDAVHILRRGLGDDLTFAAQVATETLEFVEGNLRDEERHLAPLVLAVLTAGGYYVDPPREPHPDAPTPPPDPWAEGVA